METKVFETGKSYSMHSPCDQECVWVYEVIKRTAKTVTLKGENGRTQVCRLRVFWGSEVCSPLGSYSMSPVLRAENKA